MTSKQGATPGSKTKASPILSKQKTNGGKAAQANPENNFDNECSFSENQVGKNLNEKDVEIEHLKTTVIALNEKVEVLNDLKQDVVNQKDMLKQSEERRTELQIHIEKTSIKINQDTKEHGAYQSEIISENEQLKQEIQKLKAAHAKKEQENLQQLEELNQNHHNEVKQINDKFNRQIKSMSDENTRKITNINDENAKKVNQLNDDHSNKVTQLNEEHHKKMEEQQKRLDDANREHHKIVENLNNTHHKKVEQLENKHHSEVDQLNKDHHNKMEELRNELNSTVERMNNEKETLRKNKDAQIKNLEKEKEDQRVHYEKIINDLDIKLKKSQSQILELTSTVIELREIITKKEDVENQLAMAKSHIDQIDSQKQQLQKELETASDYILELEEKVYKANKTSLELLRQLKDAEIEIETLKNYIIELKQRIAVYIPVKDDAIDKKLAEFINNYPERQKLKIMFMRESEGVYQFGSKRVAVRVDKDKINIRVGGGYLSIDEFLDQYTPTELEKLERKDPLKKFSEKIAVQKTIVGKEIRENSPVRSPSRGGGQSPSKSPTRKI